VAGILIDFEGIDASGKSTQARLLAGKLKEEGKSVVLTKEPFMELPALATILAGAQAITGFKDDDALLTMQKHALAPQTDVFLFAADRAEHVNKVISPSIAEGKIVITDRYYPSSIVYQSIFGGLPEEWIRQVNSFAPVPEAIVLIDIDAGKAMERVAGEKRRLARFDVLEKQEKIRGAYLRLAEKEKWVVVGGESSVEEVHEKIVAALKERKLI